MNKDSHQPVIPVSPIELLLCIAFVACLVRLIAWPDGWIAAVTVALLVGLIGFHLRDRLNLLDLRNFKVQLNEVRRSKEEIRELSVLTVKLIWLSQDGMITLDRGEGTNREMREAAKAILRHAEIPEDDPIFALVEEMEPEQGGVA